MDEEELLKAWQARARRSCSAHYQLGNRYAHINGFLSIAVVILSGFVGSSVFASLQDKWQWPWILGGLSVAAAVIVGIQRAVGLSELAERHRVAGAGWDQMFNELSVARTRPDQATTTLDHVRKEMASLVDKSPYIPQTLFRDLKIEQAYDQALGDEAG